MAVIFIIPLYVIDRIKVSRLGNSGATSVHHLFLNKPVNLVMGHTKQFSKHILVMLTNQRRGTRNPGRRSGETPGRPDNRSLS
jgi:hypothetical protein